MNNNFNDLNLKVNANILLYFIVLYINILEQLILFCIN